MLSKSLFSLFLGIATALNSQVLPVGTVDGTVRDSTGGLLPSITVTLKNPDTGVTAEAATNETGYFFFPLVNPGRYEVSVEKPGFKRGAQEIIVRTGIRSTADFSLELGQVSESVQVTGQAALLETSTASVSRNIQQRVITDMPLLARNVLMLVNLSPGITNNSPTSNTNGLIDIDSTSYTSASGANNRTNEFLMDGIPNNVSDRVAYIPSVDDVEEFTVQTNALDAEYGHGGGMFVNVVTKGGTNEFHGSLYDFFRNDKLNANAFFSNKANAKRPVFRFNQYGLTAGGPVIRNKVFWFFNFEGLRQRTPKQYRFTVPTALQRGGDFSQTFNAAGALFQIADPWSTVSSGGSAVRTPSPATKSPRTASTPSPPTSSRAIPMRTSRATSTPAPTTTSARSPRPTTARTTPSASIPTSGSTASLRAGLTTRASRNADPVGHRRRRWSPRRKQPRPNLHRPQRCLPHQPDPRPLRPGRLHSLDPGGNPPQLRPDHSRLLPCPRRPDAAAHLPAVQQLGHVLHRGLRGPVV